MNTVIERLNEFQSRRKEIQEDRRLSDLGKSSQVQRLQAEIDEYRQTALIYLRGDWSRVRREYNALSARQLAENERAARAWDYSRLNYAAAAVRGAVRSAPDLAAVERQYSQSVQDRYMTRAWGETGLGEIVGRFPPGVDRGQLERRITADLAAVMTTPELQAVAADGKKLADEILQLHNDTLAASRFYGGGNAFSGKDEFQELVSGVRIDRTYHPESYSHFEEITVTLEDAPVLEMA